jgi:glycine/D-amino acid oxidase-like deaminating enzyme
VVGSGMTGAMVAWLLAEAGLEVVAVDRRPLSTGSTAASTALLAVDLDATLDELADRYGMHFAGAVYRRTERALHGLAELIQQLNIGCELQCRPSLLLAGENGDVAALRAEAAARETAGVAAEFIDRRELRSRFGIAREAAILSPLALEFDPLSLCQGLWARGQMAGARLYPGTGVIDQRWDGEQPVVHTSTGYSIDTTHIVFATGYEATEMFPELCKRISLKSTFVTSTGPCPEHLWPDRAIVTERAKPYCYVRTTADDRIVVGGGDIDGVDPARQQRLLPGKSAELLAKLGRMFPALPPLTAERSWAGAFADTEDGLPYIGCADFVERCHFALGYGGNGMVLSIVAAQIIRDAILARSNSAAPLFSFERGRPSAADRLAG